MSTGFAFLQPGGCGGLWCPDFLKSLVSVILVNSTVIRKRSYLECAPASESDMLLYAIGTGELVAEYARDASNQGLSRNNTHSFQKKVAFSVATKAHKKEEGGQVLTLWKHSYSYPIPNFLLNNSSTEQCCTIHKADATLLPSLLHNNPPTPCCSKCLETHAGVIIISLLMLYWRHLLNGAWNVPSNFFLSLNSFFVIFYILIPGYWNILVYIIFYTSKSPTKVYYCILTNLLLHTDSLLSSRARDQEQNVLT